MDRLVDLIETEVVGNRVPNLIGLRGEEGSRAQRVVVIINEIEVTAHDGASLAVKRKERSELVNFKGVVMGSSGEVQINNLERDVLGVGGVGGEEDGLGVPVTGMAEIGVGKVVGREIGRGDGNQATGMPSTTRGKRRVGIKRGPTPKEEGESKAFIGVKLGFLKAYDVTNASKLLDVLRDVRVTGIARGAAMIIGDRVSVEGGNPWGGDDGNGVRGGRGEGRNVKG